jgi:nicotinamide-nucleotide amidase
MLFNIDQLAFIKNKLVDANKTLAVAESVTSGFIQAAFSSAPEATLFFQGGLTAYNAGQKCRQLSVEPIHAQQVNCVSEKVTESMAAAVNNIFLSDIGIAITGYASTVPEIGVHSLFAFFAITSGQKLLLLKKITSSKKDSIEVQLDYTKQVLDHLQILVTDDLHL